VPASGREEFLKALFFRYDKKKEGIVRSRTFFKILQEDLGIFISYASFQILWTAIDEDLSGGLDEDEVLRLFAATPADEDTSTTPIVALREALRTLLLSTQLPLKDWEGYIHGIFRQYDADGSGEISRDEFFAMLEHLNIEVPLAERDELFQEVDKDNSGSTSFDEFFRVCFK